MKSSDKWIKVLNIGKWAAFLFGIIMYMGTRGSFGETLATFLAIIATVAFFSIARNEETRQIGKNIAEVIEDAISRVDMIQSVIEIKRIKKGLIARVYFINARDKSKLLHMAISKGLERCKYSRYIWMMQMTNMNSVDDLKTTQRALNDQLIDALLKEQERRKNEENDK